MIFRGLDCGSLPRAAIRKALGLDLTAGEVHFSARAQEHAFRGHPSDFAICMAAITHVVTTPDYVGRSPHQPDGLELIGELESEGAIVLVAVKLRPDKRGRYMVASTYRIDRDKLARRLRKRFVSRI